VEYGTAPWGIYRKVDLVCKTYEELQHQWHGEMLINQVSGSWMKGNHGSTPGSYKSSLEYPPICNDERRAQEYGVLAGPKPCTLDREGRKITCSTAINTETQ
jgi:hypothetical protein